MHRAGAGAGGGSGAHRHKDRKRARSSGGGGAGGGRDNGGSGRTKEAIIGVGALQLRQAAVAGDVPALRKLVDAKVDLDVSTDRAQWRALHHAAFQGHDACVEFLVGAKANLQVHSSVWIDVLRAVAWRRGGMLSLPACFLRAVPSSLVLFS